MKEIHILTILNSNRCRIPLVRHTCMYEGRYIFYTNSLSRLLLPGLNGLNKVIIADWFYFKN